MRTVSVIDLANDFDFDQRGALRDEAEGVGGCVGQIDDAVTRRGAVIIDRDADGFSVPEIGDTEFGAAGKFPVGGGELSGRVGATASGFVAFERLAIEGGVAALRLRLRLIG